MSTENVRNFVHLFEECQTRIQTLGELLLISCKPRPVFISPQDLEVTNENFVKCRDRVISLLNKMCILSKDISSQIHVERVQVEKQLHSPLLSLSNTTVSLTQLCAHIAYLMAVHCQGSKSATLGLVSSHFQLVQADLELKFVCARLKRSREHDLSPHMLVEMCSTITKSLSCITDICKEAAEKISDPHEQDQFKLCVKAITSTTGCLVSSVKSLKTRQQQQHHHHHQHHQQQQHASSTTTYEGDNNLIQRVVHFCAPVTATSAALTAFATEDKFLGQPALLSAVGENIYKSVLGLCMSMVSANVQIFKATRDLLHDPTKRKHKDRISLCVESISRSAFRLRDFLLSYDFASSSTGTNVMTGVRGNSHAGLDKHLAVIKDGEITTSFPAAATATTTRKSENCNDNVDTLSSEVGKGLLLSIRQPDKAHRHHNHHHHHGSSSSDRRSSSSSSSSSLGLLSSPSSPSTRVEGADNTATASTLLLLSPNSSSNSSSSSMSKSMTGGSPSSSPKLSSKSSSSDSKKRHHRKSSSKHLSNSGSQASSPQHKTPSTFSSSKTGGAGGLSYSPNETGSSRLSYSPNETGSSRLSPVSMPSALITSLSTTTAVISSPSSPTSSSSSSSTVTTCSTPLSLSLSSPLAVDSPPQSSSPSSLSPVPITSSPSSHHHHSPKQAASSSPQSSAGGKSTEISSSSPPQ